MAHVIQQNIELSILEACSACLSCHLHSSGQSGTLPRCWPGRMLHIKACCNLVLIKVSSNLTHHCLLLVCFQFFNLSYHLTNTIVFHLSEVKAWIHSPLQSLSSHPGGSLSTWEKKQYTFTPWRGWLNTWSAVKLVLMHSFESIMKIWLTFLSFSCEHPTISYCLNLWKCDQYFHMRKYNNHL